jgi:hypothetical protein
LLAAFAENPVERLIRDRVVGARYFDFLGLADVELALVKAGRIMAFPARDPE